MNRVNPMSGLPIDRLVPRRTDPEWLESQYLNPENHVLVMVEGRVLVRGAGPDAQLLDLPAGQRRHSSYHALLGRIGNVTYFAASVTSEVASELTDAAPDAKLSGLRGLLYRLEGSQASLVAYARALDLWQTNHRFCGRCGSETRQDQGGFRMMCTNRDCRRQHFPRLDPAVITIVGHEGRCLLGRQPSWPPGRYSTLAGFVEPGESLEDAVRREVEEESGVLVGPVHYHSSQPWPFPSSLMVGFTGEALTTDIRCDDELEDARFFAPDELEELVRSGELILPFEASVSFHLIADWMEQTHGVDIRTWSKR
ncbi:MAG: NAD(+) diphosphatase [Pseudomonadota bacterium]